MGDDAEPELVQLPNGQLVRPSAVVGVQLLPAIPPDTVRGVYGYPERVAVFVHCLSAYPHILYPPEGQSAGELAAALSQRFRR
jgi:hypothetical protein